MKIQKVNSAMCRVTRDISRPMDGWPRWHVQAKTTGPVPIRTATRVRDQLVSQIWTQVRVHGPWETCGQIKMGHLPPRKQES